MNMKDVWRCVTKESGRQFVIKNGEGKRQKLSVDNLLIDTQMLKVVSEHDWLDYKTLKFTQ